MPSTIISLTSDFGHSSGYVGVMKGVALSLNPHAALVDISHDVPPQDIAHGAFVLGSIYRYFPPESIHLAVVDPGVGTSRRALLLVTPAGKFLAPDNGLLTYVVADQERPNSGEGLEGAQEGTSRHEGLADSQRTFMEPFATPVPDGCSAYVLNRAEFWHRPVSDTFHGRDIFAPVAAHLSRGVPPERFGDAVGELVNLNIHSARGQGDAIEGRIIFVDHFGNLVSNIRSPDIVGGEVEVEVGGARIKGLSRSYAEGRGVTALIGSHGYLEIAETNGSAAERLGAGVGSGVTVARQELVP